MSLEDLEPFGLEWELEQNERMYGEAPLESEHSMAHREAAQLGRSCPFDCEPDGDWEQVGEDEWVRRGPADEGPAEDDFISSRDLDEAAGQAEDRDFAAWGW
jgi:hypothetical protein